MGGTTFFATSNFTRWIIATFYFTLLWPEFTQSAAKIYQVGYVKEPATLLRYDEPDRDTMLKNVKTFETADKVSHDKESSSIEMAFSGISRSVAESLAASESGIVMIGVNEPETEKDGSSSHRAIEDSSLLGFERSLRQFNGAKGNSIASVRVLREVGLVIIEFAKDAQENDVKDVLRAAWEKDEIVRFIETDSKVEMRVKSEEESVETEAAVAPLRTLTSNTANLSTDEKQAHTTKTPRELLLASINKRVSSLFDPVSEYIFNRFSLVPGSNPFYDINFDPFSAFASNFAQAAQSIQNNPFYAAAMQQAGNGLFSQFTNNLFGPLISTNRDNMPNDRYFSYQWGMDNPFNNVIDINGPGLWQEMRSSSYTPHEVVVAHIDTGIDRNHPDIAANVWSNSNEIPNNGVDDDGNGYVDDVHGWDFHNNDPDSLDGQTHGTHTAGTLGAIGDNGIGIAGVLWNVKLMPLKFVDRISGAVSAIDYSINMGAKVSTNSWGYNHYSSSLLRSIERSNAAGQLFVCAVDNKGQDNAKFTDYPPNFNLPNMLNVASITARGELDTTSNYGRYNVHLAAPGRRTYSLLPNNRYGYKDGTSTATPQVAGVAAALLSYFPDLTVSELKSIIMDSVTPLPALKDKLITGGILNAEAAFKLATLRNGAPGRRGS